MTESSHQRASRNPGRLVLVVWSGLSVVAILAHLVPAVIGWAQPEIRTVRAVGDLEGRLAIAAKHLLKFAQHVRAEPGDRAPGPTLS